MLGNEDNLRNIDPATHHSDLNLEVNLVSFNKHSVNKSHNYPNKTFHPIIQSNYLKCIVER